MDPVTDMLNRIRNAQLAQKEIVSIPFSNLKYEIARLLEKEKFIKKIEKKGRKADKTIEITLKYQDKAPAISDLKRVSRPGQKIYLPADRIRRIKQGYGVAIISTSKGLMTDKEARKHKIGGEIICEVW